MPGNCVLGVVKAIDPQAWKTSVDCFFYFRDLFQGFLAISLSLFYRLPRPPPNRREPHFFGWHCLPSWRVYFGARYPLCAFSTTGTGYNTANRYALPGAFFGFLCVFQGSLFRWLFRVTSVCASFSGDGVTSVCASFSCSGCFFWTSASQ